MLRVRPSSLYYAQDDVPQTLLLAGYNGTIAIISKPQRLDISSVCWLVGSYIRVMIGVLSVRCW
jgi:hypothetical protein